MGQARAIDDAYGRACVADAGALLAAGRIRMLGQRSNAEALAMTAAATLVAYPSVHEDCPNAILEALAAGRVIVCADVPATRELAADAAVLVPDPRDGSIAAALERALFDAPLRAKLEAAARRRASRYTWSAASDATARVLDDAFSELEMRARGSIRAAL